MQTYKSNVAAKRRTWTTVTGRADARNQEGLRRRRLEALESPQSRGADVLDLPEDERADVVYVRRALLALAELLGRLAADAPDLARELVPVLFVLRRLLAERLSKCICTFFLITGRRSFSIPGGAPFDVLRRIFDPPATLV